MINLLIFGTAVGMAYVAICLTKIIIKESHHRLKRNPTKLYVAAKAFHTIYTEKRHIYSDSEHTSLVANTHEVQEAINTVADKFNDELAQEKLIMDVQELIK